MIKRVLAFILVFFTAITAPFSAYCETVYALDDIKNAVEGVISYKSDVLGAENVDELLDALSENAGNFSADWYYIAMSQFGISCENEKSVKALKKTVDGFYSDGLENVKATDLQRTAFALSACGADITDVDGHNLLADASYNRGIVKEVDSQGVNSASYALLLIDSKKYKLPSDAYNTRDDIVEMIISSELEDGGFTLFGQIADIDMTTIALQALAPYKDEKKVKPVIERALDILSRRQNKTGAYKSFSNEISCESTAQVILALTALNINPISDSRFIKDGNNVISGLMEFRLESGAFSHFKDGKSDNMASYQSLCALVSCYRYLKGIKSFYDFIEKPEEEIIQIDFSAPKAVKTKRVKTDNNSDKKNKITDSEKKSTDETEAPTEYSKSEKKKSKNKTEKKSESSVVEESVEADAVQADAVAEPINNNSDKENNNNFIYTDAALLICLYIIIFINKRRALK